MNRHLTHQQLCDLVIAPSARLDASDTATADVAIAQDHLRDCYACSAELETLTASLSGYRDTAHAVAQRNFTASPRLAHAPLLTQRSPFHPVYWAVAATALVIAILPLTAPRPKPVQPQPTQAAVTSAASSESDAALLEDINQDLSVSIPPSLQPLADPTATSSSNIDSTPKD